MTSPNTKTDNEDQRHDNKGSSQQKEHYDVTLSGKETPNLKLATVAESSETIAGHTPNADFSRKMSIKKAKDRLTSEPRSKRDNEVS